jgi:hypothetical protein
MAVLHRLREARMRPDREVLLAVVILGNDPAGVTVKEPRTSAWLDARFTK